MMKKCKYLKSITGKAQASGTFGYLFLFTGTLILTILMLYMLAMAGLITQQHAADDALADAVLASMVIDDAAFAETGLTGEPVVRFRDRQGSWELYRTILAAELSGSSLFENLTLPEYILYEVNEGTVTVYNYGPSGLTNVTEGPAGTVTTPGGAEVTKTSAYARFSFDIKSLLTGQRVPKTRDIYCTMETEGIELPEGFFPETGTEETRSEETRSEETGSEETEEEPMPETPEEPEGES